LMREDTDIEDVESSILADNTDSLNGSEILSQSSQSSTILKPRNQFVLQSESLAIV
ncbi:24972_t:CDS:1, partial [Gigaspora rosea]